MSHIFMSYSRNDKNCVDRVYQALNADDYAAWIDQRDIPISSNWQMRITEAIAESSVFMLFWSHNAHESGYVGQEIELAYKRAFAAADQLAIYVIRLDDTPLPSIFSHIQAFDLTSGCNGTKIAELIAQIPPQVRRFSFDKPLKDQNASRVPDTNFVSVPFMYDPSGYCKAHIIGLPDAKMPTSPDELIVCLQFYQPKNKNIPEEVRRVFATDALWMLHITGPTHPDPGKSDQYGLDNYNQVQWATSREFIINAIQKAANQSKTTLKIFALTPNALLGGVMTSFNRFWHVQLYNWTGDKAVYAQVIDLPRN